MSDINEQINILRYVANGLEIGSYDVGILIDMLNQAADTIESLSSELKSKDEEYRTILREIGVKIFCVETREYHSDTVVLHDDVEEIILTHMKGGSDGKNKN